MTAAESEDSGKKRNDRQKPLPHPPIPPLRQILLTAIMQPSPKRLGIFGQVSEDAAPPRALPFLGRLPVSSTLEYRRAPVYTG